MIAYYYGQQMQIYLSVNSLFIFSFNQMNKGILQNIKLMSTPHQQGDNNQKQQQGQEQEQDQSQDPNALTEEDKKVYADIMGSINRMDKKLKNVKEKVPSDTKQSSDHKRNTVNEMTSKLIQSKQNSDIVTKQDLVSDVQQTFEEVVVNVYTQNQQMKKKINSLIAIIKDQNKKINEHRNREDKLKEQNQKLREQLVKYKDGQLMAEHHTTSNKKSAANVNNASRVVKNPNNRTNTHETEDYDFWSMPNNESNVKKRKDFVADSGLWVNDKDIDKSVFITENKGKK